MKIVNTVQDLKQTLHTQKATIGFVPTMGALHDGHISLIKKARSENDIVVVSIFINPTQFLAGEDLDKYPSKLKEDEHICSISSVDILFTPNIQTMYSKDEVTIKAPTIRSYTLEGQRRPTHFDGVLQIVLKLFNIVKPTNAYFGKKDAQQLSLIKQMVDNLFLDINIVACEIIREADGLAMSSRNVYLTKEQRTLALNISKGLNIASNMILQECKDCGNIIQAITDVIIDMDIEYIVVVNKRFEKIDSIELNNSIILVAVKIGDTRLIDNIWV
jgi:pantoate--beta-alanine ligase